MKTIIKAQVNDQTLRIISLPKLASGGAEEIRVEVTFCSKWDGMGKTAVFYRNKGKVYEVVMVNDACVIPYEVMTEPGKVYFGVVGVEGETVRTSEVVALTIQQGSIIAAVTVPLPDVYKQILTAYGQVNQRIVAEEANRAAEVAVERARIDNLIANGTADGAEVVDIRVGHNGNTFASAGEAVREQIKDTRRDHFQTVGAYGYVSWGAPFTFIPNVARNGDSYLRVDFVTDIGVYWKGSKTGVRFTPDATANLGGDIEITSETKATIYLAPYKHLVFNQATGLLHLRNGANLQDGDISLIKTGYGYPVGGTLMEEHLLQNSAAQNERLTVLESARIPFNGDEAVQTYAALLDNTNNVEKFLFFTDPHLCEGTGWEDEFHEYMNRLKAYHDVAPVDFVICGGDWIGNSDTKAKACYKLGFIHSQMRRLFPRYYLAVGNHDTNYQGVAEEGSAANSGQLTNETIRNLWFQDHGKNYYIFKTANTTFFVFDTGLDWDAVNQTMTAYYTEQLDWFKEEIEKVAGNIALVFHIGYVTEAKDIHPLVTAVTSYASSFNSSHTDAKVRFALTGHTHTDDVATVNTIPMVVTTHLRDGGSPSFDMCLADYNNDSLHLVRVGSGSHRTVSI